MATHMPWAHTHTPVTYMHSFAHTQFPTGEPQGVWGGGPQGSAAVQPDNHTHDPEA